MQRTWRRLLTGLAGTLTLASCTGSAPQQQAETPQVSTHVPEEPEPGAPEMLDLDARNRTDKSDEGADESEEIEPQEARRRAALQTALAAIEGTPATTDAPLRFEVVQQGPDLPWILVILNQSQKPYVLAADTRLLSFEVKVPGKRRSETCELPANVTPSRAQTQTNLVLPPGYAVTETFDPRLYCFSSHGQERLVPGAVLEPRFGWEERVKVRWEKGKRLEIPLEEQKPPYVAAPVKPKARISLNEPFTLETSEKIQLEATIGETKSSAVEAAKASNPIKVLKGSPIALGSDYATWSHVGLDSPPQDVTVESTNPFELQMIQGSDAHSERTVTVTLALKNRSEVEYRVYFRRELLTFQVLGPQGYVICDPQPDERSPSSLAFTTMSPGETLRVANRLVELCPNGTFGDPGLYLVHAQYDTQEAGDEHGLQAWTGQVASSEPVAVRVRTARQPVQWAPMPVYPVALEGPDKTAETTEPASY